jgi:hypothetical protein
MAQGDGPLGSKRKEPVKHQVTRAPRQTPKEGRQRLQTPKETRQRSRPDKRKRSEQGKPELEPPNKKRSPPVTQAISSELGEACRSEDRVGDEGGATEEDKDISAEGHHQEIPVYIVPRIQLQRTTATHSGRTGITWTSRT